MLVSIITPTYNSVQFVSETINSILNQTFKDWELLITDDCSTDSTWDLLQDYAKKDNRIKIFRLENNSGAGVARNNSIKKAKGKYIAFCDSDDQWKPNKLEVQISFMQKKGCALSYSSYLVINEKGDIKGEVVAKDVLDYKDMLKNNYIGCLTAIYDTQKVGKVYMSEIRKRQDWTLWLSILKKTNKAFGVKEPLAIYRKRSDSISANKLNLLKYNWSVYYDVEGFSKVLSFYYMIRYMVYYFAKKIK